MTVARDELAAVTRDHPAIAALVLELLVEQRDGDRPPPLEIPERTGPDATALLEQLGTVTQENVSLKSRVADVQEQLQAALDLGHAIGAEKHDDELAALRVETETLRQQLAAELEKPRRRAIDLEDELAEVKQQLAGARIQVESLEGERSAHLREIADLRRRQVAAARAYRAPEKQNTVVETTPCRVDGCAGHGPMRGQWAKLCPPHRADLAAGGVVTIDGKTCQRLAKGLTPVRATHCEDCGAKLSKYRKATETRCATHAGVTAS